MPISTVECCDCMDFMAKFPDKYFELAIVDPPYGAAGGIERTGGSWSAKYDSDKKIKKWDISPSGDYFEELFRVSKNQIIWGGNYFPLPPNRCFVIWKKHIPEKFSLSMCEYAWCSFNANAKWVEYPSNTEKERFHPTQKPVALYVWLLENYAKPGDKILDTHLGSQSSRIAAYQMGFDFWGCEIDPEYFADGCKRFEKETEQLALFTSETTTREQNKLFKEG
jgi:site-specific DNA-methyltransferase (adenine-specific)